MAQGVSGCGIYPALRCEGNTEVDPASFSKIMRLTPSLKTELQIAKMLANVDPEQLYTLYPTRVCKVHPNNIEPHAENFTQCRITNPTGVFDPFVLETLASQRDQFAVLQAPYGGMDLFLYLNDMSKQGVPRDHILPFFRAARNMLVGLKHLHQRGLYHMDIKTENCVLSFNADGLPQTMRYIDFGLSLTNDTVAQRIGLYKPIYFLYPLELRFATMTSAEREAMTDEDLANHIEAFYENNLKNARIPRDMFWSKEKTRILTPEVVRSDIFGSFPSDPRILAQKIDMYGLGIFLYTLVTFLFGFHIEGRRVYHVGSNGQLSPVFGGPTTTPDGEFRKALSRGFLSDYVDLCYIMMLQNMDERADIDEVIGTYDQLLGKLEHVLEEEEEAKEPPTKRQKTRRGGRRYTKN